MADLIIMKTAGKSAPEVEKGGADSEKLIKGEYSTKTWNHFTGEDGRRAFLRRGHERGHEGTCGHTAGRSVRKSE